MPPQNDQANRSILDQLTASAAPSVPTALAPAAGGDATVPPPVSLADAPATTPGSTDNLEAISASPDNLAAGATAEKALSPDEHVGILKTIGRLAAGATGLESPDSSPQAGMGAKIMDLLGRVGTAGTMAIGTPAQKQAMIEQEKIPLQMALAKNEMAYRNGMLGLKGQANQNTADRTQLQYGLGANGAPEGTSRITADASGDRAAAAQLMAAEHTKQIEASLQGLNYVDPNLAHAIGRDDIAGQNISPIAYQQQIGNVVKSRGFHTVDTGKDGPDAGQWVVDNVGRKIYQISQFSPANARGASYGANRPVQVLSPTTGNPEIETAGTAEANHASPAGLGAQIMSKQAQFSDIYSGLGSVRSAVNEMAQEGGPQLPATTIGKLVMASRETDPTIAKTAFDTILGSEQLTPAQQDFVVSVQQLNERAMSLRNLAGMGNASDSLRAAIRATLPSAKSGDISLMRKQLDAVTNLVDNLHTGVPNINVPKTGTSVPNSSTSSNAPAEGSTATGPGGHKITFSGGRWVDAATKQPIQ